MAEARAAIAEPHVKFHEEGTSIVEQEERVAKSLFQDLRLCAFRTRFVLNGGFFVLFCCCGQVIEYHMVFVVSQLMLQVQVKKCTNKPGQGPNSSLILYSVKALFYENIIKIQQTLEKLQLRYHRQHRGVCTLPKRCTSCFKTIGF